MNQNKISIARALKQKSRIAGKVRNCLDILKNDNSCPEGTERAFDLAAVLVEYKQYSEELIRYKAVIASANFGIIVKLTELEENRSMIASLKKIDTTNGGKQEYGSSYNVTAALTKADIQREIDSLQQRADDLQDEIDDYNASHFVSLEV